METDGMGVGEGEEVEGVAVGREKEGWIGGSSEEMGKE